MSDILQANSSESAILRITFPGELLRGFQIDYCRKYHHSSYVSMLAIIDPCLLSTVLHSDLFTAWAHFLLRSDCRKVYGALLQGPSPNSTFSTVLW